MQSANRGFIDFFLSTCNEYEKSNWKKWSTCTETSFVEGETVDHFFDRFTQNDFFLEINVTVGKHLVEKLLQNNSLNWAQHNSCYLDYQNVITLINQQEFVTLVTYMVIHLKHYCFNGFFFDLSVQLRIVGKYARQKSWMSWKSNFVSV